MRYLLSFGVLLVLIFGTVWYWQSNQPGTSDGGQLNVAVYPLYSGVTWGAAYAATTTDGSGYRIDAVAAQNTTNIAEVSTPFMQYYQQKLVAEGWEPDMSREAGGPGAQVSYYVKGDQFVIAAFQSDFLVQSPDAPSECPCNVHFSLTTGTQQEGPTPAQVQALHEYQDTARGFTITLPTIVASSSSTTMYSVDPTYVYTADGPKHEIPGVKFTIPASYTDGTNLASDSYISVEKASSSACTAGEFFADKQIRSQAVQEGAVKYFTASSTDAGAGNRYETYVYARTDSNPCTAVRYFIHYGAIQNYPEGAVQEFDKAALLSDFDQIRRTLRLE